MFKGVNVQGCKKQIYKKILLYKIVYNKMLKNISYFSNTSDYLSILNAALVTDLLFIFLLIFGVYHTKILEQWYKKYTLAAVIQDTLILVIGVIIARFLYKPIFGEEFSLIKFTLLAVLIQMIHDIFFYFFFTWIPKGKNHMMDTFKLYAKEVKFNAILADSCMMALTSFLSAYFASFSANINLILLILTIYIIPYAVYTF
jgi:uncharacterized protein YacL